MLRDRERDRRTSPTTSDVAPPDPRALCCAVCMHRISHDDYRIAMAGAHEHTFVNPHGIVHHVGCFALAPGCVHTGTTETAFTWFPGWTWQLAECARCRTHLGWLYRNAGEQFHCAPPFGAAARSGRAGPCEFHGLIVGALRPG